MGGRKKVVVDPVVEQREIREKLVGWYESSVKSYLRQLASVRKSREVLEAVWSGIDGGYEYFEIEIETGLVKTLLQIKEVVSPSRMKEMEKIRVKRPWVNEGVYPKMISGMVLACTSDRNPYDVVRTISCDEITEVKAVCLEDLPLYVGWKFVSPFFGEILKGA
jgi:hypothetical protein